MSLFCIPLIACAMVACLRWLGRPWWCSCRRPDAWATGADCYSQHLFDPWTITHVGHGMFIYGFWRGFLIDHPVGLAVMLTIAVEALWEVKENTPRVIERYRRSGDKNYYGDSIVNSCGDLLACLVGALFTSLFV